MELTPFFAEYWVMQDNDKQYIYFYKSVLNEIHIYDLKERQFIDKHHFPEEVRRYVLRAYDPEKNIFLFSNPNLSHYLYDMKDKGLEYFDDFKTDNEKNYLFSYIYLNEYNYLAANSALWDRSNISRINLKDKTIKNIFPDIMPGDIYGLRKINDTSYSFLVGFYKDTEKYLCFWEL